MTTRFNMPNSGMRSGYNNPNTVNDLSIPSCGLEDVDKAIFDLMNKQIPFTVMSNDELQKVNVIFAAGEKWAVIKKKKQIRDRQGRLILPLITIGRTSIEQDPTKDITGRGINQQTGEMIICRRLASDDRNYQNLLNRLYIKNQTNIAQLVSDSLSTTRTIGDMFSDVDVAKGGLLKSNRSKNIWETITAPTPQFYTAHYEVIIWTQYTTHMNEIIELFMSSQLPQGNAFKISNPDNSGYWFIATVENNEYTPENNFDDMFEQDRIIKHKFNISVPAYIFASKVPGAPVPIRRYLSCTEIEFGVDVNVNEINVNNTIKDPFLGMDDPTLPLENHSPEYLRTLDGREQNYSRLADRSNHNNTDPALNSYQRGIKPPQYMQVKHLDSFGNVSFENKKITTYNHVTGESTFKMSSEEFGSWFSVTSGSI